MLNCKHNKHIMWTRFILLAGVSCIVLSIAPSFAVAQVITTPSDLPAGSDPSRLIPLQNSKTPNFDNLKAPRGKTESIANVPAGSEDVKFILNNVTINGATAYSASELKALSAPMVGQTISLADLFVLSSKIQQTYFDDGYSFVRVALPKQNLKNGNVTIDVVEGGVGAVNAENLNSQSPFIRDAIDQIKSMQPVNVLKLERLLLIMNDYVDGEVVSVISALENQKQNGQIKVTLLQQNKKAFSGLVGVNNHGSIFSGPLQANANLSYKIAGLNYTKASLSMAGAVPLNDMKNMGLNVSTPIFGASGASVNAGYSRGWTEAGDTLDVFDIIGSTEMINLGVSYPIMRQRDVDFTASLGLAINNIDSDFLSNDLYRDRIRVLSAGLNYSGSDNFSGMNYAGLTLSHGFNILGARETGSINLSRDEGKSDFVKAEGQIGRLQSLPSGFEVYGNIAFQWANDPLLSSEEFGFGGSDRGRGYTSSEITGDRGASASLEIRKNLPAPKLNLAFQPFAFYDVGMVKNLDSTDRRIDSAASVGFGTRVFAPNGISGNVTIAKPLTRPLENPMKYTSEDGLQILFSVQKSF